MPYLNETGLSYYDPKLKEWIGDQPVKTVPSSLYPWTLTDKAGAVTCWPVGGTELLPTVDFMFTETGPAEGTKGPDNPSTITGVSQTKVTRCGKNLFPLSKYPSLDIVRNVNGVDFVLKSTGDLVCNGTATARASFFFIPVSMRFKLPGGGTYHLSGMPNSTYGNNVVLNISSYISLAPQEGYVNQANDTGSGDTFTLDSDRFLVVGVAVASGVTLNNYTIRPQLELGTAATAFEPYAGTDYTIDLGNTYYGGSIDLATGVMTVTHVAVTPDASTVDISSAPAALPLDYADTYGRTITSADGTSLVVGSTGGTVVYKLATPQTVQLTPTQILSLAQPDKYTPRLNTIYTDASTVQVGYVKSPIREEYELQQAIVAQGGNI